MDKHLDALGYLLAALVFSVGFLSARVHSNLDSIIRTVSERSSAVRQELSEGKRLAPADLADLLGVIHRSTDYIAVGSRVLNWIIFAITCAVLVDAVGLSVDGVRGPGNELIVICLLFFAGLAVVVFSEFDVRRVSIERRREIATSTLGRLQNLGYAIVDADVAGGRRELARLRTTFPTWGLLVELDSYVDLLEDLPAQGLGRVESLIETGRDLYVSPIVGTACCLQLGSTSSALALLSRIERRGESVSDLPSIRHALAITAGHLPALLAAQDPSRSASPPGDKAHVAAFRGSGQEVGHRRLPVRDLSLALDPVMVPQMAPLMRTMDLWERGSNLSDFSSDGILVPLLHLVLSWEKRSSSDKPSVAAVLGPHCSGSADAEMHESVGLVAFACGEPRVALGFFESAIRLAPAAARSHWGRAIACHRVGWFDAAATSLRRARTLSDETPLLHLTRRRFREPSARFDPALVARMYTALSGTDRFELALLGIDMGIEQGTRIRARFAQTLIKLALDEGACEAAA